MTTFGYSLMGEEHDPCDLVAAGRRAEEVGFDFLVAFDHYHPWVPQQEHSPYVWSVLGAMAACPTRRSDRRRHRRPASGEARRRVRRPAHIGSSGPRGRRRLPECRRRRVDMDPDRGLLGRGCVQGPAACPRPLPLLGTGMEGDVRAAQPGQLRRRHRDRGSRALGEQLPAGPDLDRYVDAVRTASNAGFERVAFVQIGDDQEGWFRFWAEELAPRLGAPTHEPAAAGA